MLAQNYSATTPAKEGSHTTLTQMAKLQVHACGVHRSPPRMQMRFAAMVDSWP
jgi:hypothetical protein